MKTYTIRSTGSGKIAAALAKYCAHSKPGQILIEAGCNQSAFSLFLAKVALAYSERGASEADLASAFELISAGNCSAARQALADCALKFEGADKEVSVEEYWKKNGKAAQPSLALLDL